MSVCCPKLSNLPEAALRAVEVVRAPVVVLELAVPLVVPLVAVPLPDMPAAEVVFMEVTPPAEDEPPEDVHEPLPVVWRFTKSPKPPRRKLGMRPRFDCEVVEEQLLESPPLLLLPVEPVWDEEDEAG